MPDMSSLGPSSSVKKIRRAKRAEKGIGEEKGQRIFLFALAREPVRRQDMSSSQFL